MLTEALKQVLSRVRRRWSSWYTQLYLAVIVALIACPGFAKSPPDPGHPWLAFGDVRGHIEPCGCDPISDLGGLRRISSMIKMERLAARGVWIFDLGNNRLEPIKDDKEDSAKAALIDQSIRIIKPTASLLNVLELNSVTKTTPKPALKGRFVLSNLKVGALWPDGTIPMLKTFDLVVLGYTYRSDLEGRGIERFSNAMKDRWQKTLNTEATGRRKVLLFSGSDEDLRTILTANLFDLILSSNTAPFGKETDQLEKNEPARLLRVSDGAGVYMVPHGGQGILRGGKLRTGSAKPLAALLGKKPATTPLVTPMNSSTDPVGDELVTWLDSTWEAGTPLVDVFRKYNAAQSDRMKKLASSRMADLKTSPFAGSEACQGCHVSAYEVWKTSQHANALATLAEKKKNRDPECVTCHVIGLESKGGFVSQEASPHLANVGCESCHGPRRDHADNPRTAAKSQSGKAEAMCVSCHHPPHTTKFDFDAYWKKIFHDLK